jgi:hypothetical protein
MFSRLAAGEGAPSKVYENGSCRLGNFRSRSSGGHLVYFSNGPVLLIRAEEKRVLFGFWRGQRLRDIEGRLKPGGKYEMATMALLEDDEISAAKVKSLVKAAIELNRQLGDPTLAAKESRGARNNSR